MMKPLKHSVFYLLLLIPLVAVAQEITFEARLSKEKLGVNERLRIDFTMNRDGDNFNPPSFEGFKVIMGPSQQISSSWVNGKRSFSKTYSYVLKPIKKGSFKIGQANIEIEGNTYKTVSKQVVITAAVANPNAPKTADDIADESLHLVAEISKPNPYLNQAVTVIYKLYLAPNIRVNNFRPLDNPKYKDFWSQDIPIKRYDAKDATFQGKPYSSVVLKRVVLYPQKSGKLDIEPLALEIFAEVPTQRRDFFGRHMYRSATKTVSAGKRTLNVRPLPENGKPADFIGAVGDFQFEISASKTSLNASESLQVSVEVSGKGNLKLFKLPKPNLPSALEVYDPEYDEQVTTNVNGMQGRVADNYTVVPSFRGKYPIPSISFSFFNPNEGRYKTLKSEEMSINVLEGPTNSATVMANNQNTGSKIVVPTGSQFHFIKTATSLSNIASKRFFSSSQFYMWFLGPLAFIPLVIILRKKKERSQSNFEGMQLKKTNRLARKYLSEARKALGTKNEFYNALERALHNYLKAKLNIETSEFTKERITQTLSEKGASEDLNAAFIALLQSCEMARYSPITNLQIKDDYSEAREVIAKLDKQL